MVLGTYKEAVAARSTDKRIQEVAQDGGIASALLIYALENNIIEVNYDHAKAVTPGQFCVLYQDDLCLGGGIIDEVFK